MHDSTVGSIARREHDVIEVLFDPAYVHHSEGTPGLDKGRGWIQPARMTFTDAKITGAEPRLPAVLWEGSLRFDGRVTGNTIPLPFSGNRIEFRMTFQSGEEVMIAAARASLQLEGEAAYLDDFPGTR